MWRRLFDGEDVNGSTATNKTSLILAIHSFVSLPQSAEYEGSW